MTKNKERLTSTPPSTLEAPELHRLRYNVLNSFGLTDWKNEVISDPKGALNSYLTTGNCLEPFLIARPYETAAQRNEIKNTLINVIKNEVDLKKLSKIVKSKLALDLIREDMTSQVFLYICSNNQKIVPYIFNDPNFLDMIDMDEFLSLNQGRADDPNQKITKVYPLPDSVAANLLRIKPFVNRLEAFLTTEAFKLPDLNVLMQTNSIFLRAYEAEFKALIKSFANKSSIQELSFDDFLIKTGNIFFCQNPTFINLVMSIEEFQHKFANSLDAQLTVQNAPVTDLSNHKNTVLNYAKLLFTNQKFTEQVLENLNTCPNEKLLEQLMSASSQFLEALLSADADDLIMSRVHSIFETKALENDIENAQASIDDTVRLVIKSQNPALLKLILENAEVKKIMLESAPSLLTWIISSEIFKNESEKIELIKVILEAYSDIFNRPTELNNYVDEYESVLETFADENEQAIVRAIKKSYDLTVQHMINGIDRGYFYTKLIARLQEYYACDIFRNKYGLSPATNLAVEALNAKFPTQAESEAMSQHEDLDITKNPIFLKFSTLCSISSAYSVCKDPTDSVSTVTVTATPTPSALGQGGESPQLWGAVGSYSNTDSPAVVQTTRVCQYETNSFYSTTLPIISVFAGLGLGIGVPHFAFGVPLQYAVHIGAGSAFKAWNDIRTAKIKEESARSRALSELHDEPLVIDSQGNICLDGTEHIKDPSPSLPTTQLRTSGAKDQQKKATLLWSGKSSVGNSESNSLPDTPVAPEGKRITREFTIQKLTTQVENREHEVKALQNEVENREHEVKALQNEIETLKKSKVNEVKDSNPAAKQEDSVFAAHAKMSFAMKGVEMLAESGLIGAAIGLTAHYGFGVPFKVSNCEKAQQIKTCHIADLIKKAIVFEVQHEGYTQLVYNNLNKLLAIDNLPCPVSSPANEETQTAGDLLGTAEL